MARYQKKNFPLDDEIPLRKLTRLEESKLRKTCVCCMTTKTLIDFYSPRPGKYYGRCRQCTNEYKKKWQHETSYQKGRERERLARFRGFTDYDTYLQHKNWAVGKPCPLCSAPMVLKGRAEAVWLGREDLPNSYKEGFICKLCSSAIRRLKNNPNLQEFVDTYDVPLSDTLPEGDSVLVTPRKMGRPHGSKNRIKEN
jgi:hypothetical protein